MGIIDGKTINVSTIDRTFIAANVELEAQDENPDNLLCRFEFIELSETVRTIELANIELNVEIADEIFRFEPPPGVKVYRG